MKILAVCILLLVAAIESQAGSATTITLPPDAEIITIQGNGFKLDVTQLVKMKSDWKAVAEDLEKEKLDDQNVKGQKNNGDELRDEPEPSTPSPQETGETGATDEPGQDSGSDGSKKTLNDRDYGYLEDDLHRWIEDRATALADRVERYSEEIAQLTKGPRVVSQILLLNTLNDLDNLTKENIRSLKWIKNKLRWIMTIRNGVTNEVSDWVARKISENQIIEPKVRGKNDPGKQWIANVQAMKRVMHEQRFSEPIRESIASFLGGEFNMMERSRVYDINKPGQLLEDGLYYYRAKGRIPAYFPFFSQDSIVNGAQL